MAHLKKQKVTVHRVDGKRVPAGTPGAVKTTTESRKWYGFGIPGMGKKGVPLAADRKSAERLLARLLTDAERGQAGVGAAEDAPLGPLLAEFAAAVGRKATAKHTRDVVRDARRVLDGCRVKTVGDLRARGLVAAAEAFVGGLAAGMTSANAAYIGKHARQFTAWLTRKKKLFPADPLAGLDLPSQAATRKRRALTEAELDALLAAAPAERPFRGLTGADRAALYTAAAATGLRAGELAAVTAAGLHLDAETPRLFLDGKYTKNGEDADLPLPPAAVARLRPLAARRPAGPLWPGTWSLRAFAMIRRDLTAAGVPAAALDFHCLRHTFTTMLGRYAPLAVVQSLARHSTPVLTVGRYSHAEAAERAAAVNALPIGTSGTPVALSRADLESLVAVLGGLALALLTRPLTPAARAPGDTSEHP